MVTFSPEQEKALAAVARWRKSGGKEFLLTGAAGTGKSTLAKAVIRLPGVPEPMGLVTDNQVPRYSQQLIAAARGVRAGGDAGGAAAVAHR